MRCGLNSAGSGLGPNAGFYEHGNELYSSILARGYFIGWITVNFSRRIL